MSTENTKLATTVRFGGFSEDALTAQNAAVKSLSSGRYMKLEQGANVVRVIPPPVGQTSPARVTSLHYVEAVPGTDRTVVFACPRRELKAECPVCEYHQLLLKNARTKTEKEYAYKFAEKLSVLVNVVDRTDGSVRILQFGKKIWDALVNIRRNPRLGGDWTNPLEDGFDIVITRTGEKLNTDYSVAAARGNTALADSAAEIQDIIDSQFDLDGEVIPVVPEEVYALLGAESRQQLPAPRQHAGVRPGQHLMAGAAAARSVPQASPQYSKPSSQPTRAADVGVIDVPAETEDDFPE